jgi:hypothetical protein
MTPRRRKIIIEFLALVVCGVLAAVFWPEKPEPVYKGKKLSEWVDQAGAQDSLSGVSEAVDAIGANGIPFYLEWMGYEPGFVKRAEYKLARNTRSWFHVKWEVRDTKFIRAEGACLALRALGDTAEPAIPQLLAWATNTSTAVSPPYVYQSDFGISGLINIGRPAIPAFLSLMTNADAGVRTSAAFRSRELYGSRAILAQLRLCLQDPDRRVRAAAKYALQWFEYDSPPDSP